ncbi:putative potassium channel regulatory protein [Dirofilaria immitis]
MFIVQCALIIVTIWNSIGGASVPIWNRNFGSEIHLLKDGKNAVYDLRTQRLVNTIKQKLEFNERLLILFCVRRCYPTQSQIPRWIREFSNRNNLTAKQEHFTYQFYDNRRNSPIFNDQLIRNGSKPYLVYAIDGQLFRYEGNINNKEEFFSFLGSHELLNAEIVSTWQHLESIINTAQLCHGEKQILQIVDNNRCPMEHFELVVRAFDGVANYSFYEIIMPLTIDMDVELHTRLPELPSVCQLILLLQNDGYLWMSADADLHELIIAVESLQNVECTRGSPGVWYPIREELTAIERDYLRENKQSLILESEPSYILVGATGGIAVIVLAISIFWGLSGSTFAQN